MKLDRGILSLPSNRGAAAFALAFLTGGGDWDIYETVAENIIRGCGVSLSPLAATNAFRTTAAPSAGVPGIRRTGLGVGSFRHGRAWRKSRSMPLRWRVWRGRELYSTAAGALVIGVVMALSPLQIAWPRYTQTETLSLAAVVWTFAEILASLAERRLRVVPLGLAIVAATFIRLDGILLCIPVALTGFILHRPVVAIRRGAIAPLIVGLPIAGWAVRNAVRGVSWCRWHGAA